MLLKSIIEISSRFNRISNETANKALSPKTILLSSKTL